MSINVTKFFSVILVVQADSVIGLQQFSHILSDWL